MKSAKALLSTLKSVLPDRDMLLPILAGPFRGARVQLNPRNALRKVLGLYERELNEWLSIVLPRVNAVIDIGANEGYFSLGCCAAFHRLKKSAEIAAYEPEPEALRRLYAGIRGNRGGDVRIAVFESFVGSHVSPSMTTLNEIAASSACENVLIKIDVEGAEVEVIAEASAWLNASNYFVIEVHKEQFLDVLKGAFAKHGLRLARVDQRPLPLLGYEARGRDNWWLVSEL